MEAEAIRNAAADYSVCNISKSNAQSLVSTYKSMGVYMQETYIDCTTVYTHKKDGSDGNELVSYRDVMVELARIAEVSLSSNRVTTRALVMNNVTIIVIIAISTVSFAALVTVLVIKKRKHN